MKTVNYVQHPDMDNRQALSRAYVPLIVQQGNILQRRVYPMPEDVLCVHLGISVITVMMPIKFSLNQMGKLLLSLYTMTCIPRLLIIIKHTTK